MFSQKIIIILIRSYLVFIYRKDFNDEIYYSYLLNIESRNNQENIVDIDDIIF